MESCEKHVLENNPEVKAILKVLRGQEEELARYDRLRNRSLAARIESGAYEYWVNALLSGPFTQARNFVYNTATIAKRPIDTVMAATVSKALSTFRPNHAASRVYFNEVVPEITGIGKGFIDVFHLLGKFGKSEAELTGELAKRGYGPEIMKSSKLERIVPAITAKMYGLEGTRFENAINLIGRGIRLPGQVLSRTDLAFKLVNYQAHSYKLAARKAAAEGAEDFSAAVSRNLRSMDEATVKEVVANAAKNTLTNQNLVAKAFEPFLGSPVMKWITPFRNAPLNVVAEGLSYSPAGLYSAMKATDPVKRAEALGRVAFGSAILGGLVYTFDDYITGSGPNTTFSKDLWMASGLRENTLQVGNVLVPFENLGGLGAMLGMLTDFRKAMSNIDLSERSYGQAATDTVLTMVGVTGNYLYDNMWLRNVATLITQIRESVDLSMANKATRTRSGTSALKVASDSFISSFIPAFVNQINHYIEPNLKQITDSRSALRAKFPFLSGEMDIPYVGKIKRVPSRIGFFGRPVEYDNWHGFGFVNPSEETDGGHKERAVAQALITLDKEFNQVTDKIQGVQLTPHEREAYAMYAGLGDGKGPTLARVLYDEINRPSFRGQSKENQRDMLTSVVTRFRMNARRMMVYYNPKLRERIENTARQEAILRSTPNTGI